jgi:hypothetical protein
MLDRELFRNPPVEFRSAPFWSLNDKLDARYLRQQIRTMFEQGMGGYFMHPRAGLVDPYMSEEFLSAIGTCIEEGKRLGMKPWLYDEDRFPSGFAGGLVIEQHPEYGGKALELHDDVVEIVDLPPTTRMHDKPYPDLSNPEVTAAFLRITHERYAEKFGTDFGAAIPGIFTDEPHFNPGRGDGPRLPWSAALPEYFEARKGYDLLSHLKSLFVEEGDFRKIRFDYWESITLLFRDSFTKQVADWCDKHDLALTGHFWEHVFPSPLYTGAVMPNYAEMQAPAIDMLFNTDARPDQVGNDFIVKEVASIGDQLDKERVVSETYGASGWGLNFADQKRIADWQFALGINLVCQHLVHYSLRGHRKRDFPLSFGQVQPWSHSYQILGDYIGRVSYALTRGQYVADVLVMHPSSSTWVHFSPVENSGRNQDKIGGRLGQIGGTIKGLCVALNQLQVGYHLGDELVIAESGAAAQGVLRVGSSRYRTVILPDMPVLRRTTYELLVKFVASGGSLVLATTPPHLLEGEESDELAKFFAKPEIVSLGLDPGATVDEAYEALGSGLAEGDISSDRVRVSAKGPDAARYVYVHRRIADDTEILFLCNTSRDSDAAVTIDLPWSGGAAVWDPLTGDTWWHDGQTMAVTIPVAGSLLLSSNDRRSDPSADERPSPLMVGRATERSFRLDDWRCDRVNMNALTLKRATLETSDGAFSAEGDILALDDRLRDHLGMERRTGSSHQPWAYGHEELSKTADVTASFAFEADEGVATGSSAQLYVAVEEPGTYAVVVNGSSVRPSTRRFNDRVFRLCDIREYVQPGINIIDVRCSRYSVTSGFEWIYLVGDFRVTRTTSCVPTDPLPAIAVETVPSVGDWTQRGYPYYSGSMRYTTQFDNMGGSRFILSAGPLWMVCARVVVNGRTAGLLAFPPYEIDITDYVGKGRNTVVLEVMNSMQNLLGPHESSSDPGLCTPGSFYTTSDEYFEKSGFAGSALLKVD